MIDIHRAAAAADPFRGRTFRRMPGSALLLLLAQFAGPAEGAVLRLKDGTVLQGEIVSQDDSTVVYRGASLGEIRIPVSALADTGTAVVGRPYAVEAARREAAMLASGRLDPSDHALFFMPTAFTPVRGSFMFRDFELLFLTLGFAPTSSTTVTGGFLFPISSSLQVLTAGIKQRLWSGQDGRLALALAGNYTAPLGELDDDLGNVLASNLVFSARFPESVLGAKDAFGFHGVLGYLASQEVWTRTVYEDGVYYEKEYSDWHGGLSFGFGFEARMTEHSKFMAEYLSAAPYGEGGLAGNGLFTLGFRLHGTRLSADIAGIRPLVDEDLDDFFLWPLLVVSYRI
jgi:hypothetical protein